MILEYTDVNTIRYRIPAVNNGPFTTNRKDIPLAGEQSFRLPRTKTQTPKTR